MPNKNAKHGQHKGTAPQHEWRVFAPGAVRFDGPQAGWFDVPSSSVARRESDGTFVFRDGAGTIAEFPADSIVERKPPREPVKVTLPARFITTPASVREFQDALSAATGVQVILLPPSSKAADAVSEPQ